MCCRLSCHSLLKSVVITCCEACGCWLVLMLSKSSEHFQATLMRLVCQAISASQGLRRCKDASTNKLAHCLYMSYTIVDAAAAISVSRTLHTERLVLTTAKCSSFHTICCAAAAVVTLPGTFECSWLFALPVSRPMQLQCAIRTSAEGSISYKKAYFLALRIRLPISSLFFLARK